ncbi:MAG TPA: hypothetical protein VMU17_02275 [Elusimicrobiota bacterium]|nr:hypothetical protein [Elusimicrobiota bacterium]
MRFSLPKQAAALAVLLWASAVEARVAHLGGLIRHSEIRSVPSMSKDAAPAGSNASPQAPEDRAPKMP